jgi:hypothetical protein
MFNTSVRRSSPILPEEDRRKAPWLTQWKLDDWPVDYEQSRLPIKQLTWRKRRRTSGILGEV